MAQHHDRRRPAPQRQGLVEQLLVGDPAAAGPGWADYVSVESVTSHGEIRHIEVTGKFPLAEPLRETGYVVPGTLGAGLREQVLALTTAALTRIASVDVEVEDGGQR